MEQKKWKLKRDSLSKLLLYFKDGNVRTFYSLDWRHSFSKERDRELGLERLKKLAERHRKQIRRAIIYTVLGDSPPPMTIIDDPG